MTKLDRAMASWGAVGTVFWVLFAVIDGKDVRLAVYFPLWLGIVGTLVWRHRDTIEVRLQAWQAPLPIRFILLGFGAVLAEEILAALANHIPEGFSPPLYLVRIGQFWALNVFAFFGFVLGLCLLTRYVEFSRREVFYLAGLWGLYSEKIIFALPVTPVAFFFAAGPTIMTYGLIAVPAMLSQPYRPGRWRVHPLLKYPASYILILLFSLPAIFTLITLREHYPWAFPPASMVPP